MKYDISVLQKMIDHYSSNIETSQELYKNINNDHCWKRLAEMVANRRLIAAMIENDGESLFKGMIGNVFFDVMLYSACAGADTSRW